MESQAGTRPGGLGNISATRGAPGTGESNRLASADSTKLSRRSIASASTAEGRRVGSISFSPSTSCRSWPRCD